MQTVSIAWNVNLFSRKNKNNYFKTYSAEKFTQSAKR